MSIEEELCDVHMAESNVQVCMCHHALAVTTTDLKFDMICDSRFFQKPRNICDSCLKESMFIIKSTGTDRISNRKNMDL